jgi:Transposase
MPDGIRWVGLDVHARESTFAMFDQGTGEVITKRVVGRPHELLARLRGVERPARMVYEAGPTGYGLARWARAEGIELAVCAPGKTERPPADRVKTDKRDAVRRAWLLAAGELVLVTIPSVEREQLRDLVRCREDIRVDLARARDRIGGFLLRREIYWEGTGEAWTRKHRSWLTSIRFSDHASQATLADYLHAHDVLIARRDQVEADLAQLAISAPCAHTVARSDACAGSTRSQRPGCAPRSANGSASIIPTSCPPTSGSSPQSTPPASNAGWGRSPRPAPPTPADCSSRPLTTTAAAPWSAKRSSVANVGKHPRSSTSPGAQRRLNAR